MFQTSQEKKLVAPAGLKAIIHHLQTKYPDQQNPLQVTTLVKYWLGGQDPLDYISMYNNKGDPNKNIAEHWHYVSFGLSDLHGDERVHSRNNDEYGRSGMGFELTFRLLKTEKEINESKISGAICRPPTWPANLLQSIARYCFETGNALCFGDNIPWDRSLDETKDSKINSILITQDEQLGSIETPFGSVDFCQIVGVTEEELHKASQWNGRGVLEFLRQDSITGGDWLITDMSRTTSVFELFPETLLNLEEDLEKRGSDLAGVNADFTFSEIGPAQYVKTEIDSNSLNEKFMNEGSGMQNSCKQEGKTKFPQSMSISSNSLHESCPLDCQMLTPDSLTLNGIEIRLASYAGKFLFLAIKDRIRHGRHFTFKSRNLALTFVSESVTGSIVSKNSPYGVIGYWIQVLITDDLIPRMLQSFQEADFVDKDEIKQSIKFNWPDKNLVIVIEKTGTC